jgi:hypothetical protein
MGPTESTGSKCRSIHGKLICDDECT